MDIKVVNWDIDMTTSVSIEADKVYTKALRSLADVQDKTVGEMVRKAVDAMYGDDLKPHLDFFVAQSGHKNSHMNTSESEPASA